MKKIIAYSTSFLLIANSGICLYLFFALASEGNGLASNKAFLIGFLSLCVSFIILPLKTVSYANPRSFRVRYYNYIHNIKTNY